MIPVVNVTKFSDWSELQNIQFNTSPKSSKKSNRYQVFQCQNIITFDIETSNGYLMENGLVHQWDGILYEKYNRNNPYLPNTKEWKNYRDNNPFDKAVKVSLMYIWQCAIETQNGPMAFCGRTWGDFLEFLSLLTDEIRLSVYYKKPSSQLALRDQILHDKKKDRTQVKAFIFIHNLPFEFQHLMNLFGKEFSNYSKRKGTVRPVVFARKARKPMKAVIKYNTVSIEYRDSYVLTNKSLDAWCKDEGLPVQKLHEPEGYYDPIRTPETPLDSNELQYSINDVVSMVYGIEKYRNKYGRLENIPLTQTGSVRLVCREKIAQVNPLWVDLCNEVTKSYSLHFYKRLTEAYAGGWTHANAVHANKLLHDIVCYDFASSYPAVLCTRTYPIHPFEECDLSEYDYLINQDLHDMELNYHYLLVVKVEGVKSITNNTFWSSSKTLELNGAVIDNGKISSCESMTATFTDLDWEVFRRVYSMQYFEVVELYKSKSGYLPVEMIEVILNYYEAKTKLKDAEKDPTLTDEEIASILSRYAEAKQFINSIYGVMVTKILDRFVMITDGKWKTYDTGVYAMGDQIEVKDEEMYFFDTIESMSDESTFISYQLGVWCTAWARHNLWDCIGAQDDNGDFFMDEKIVYCDTDSTKGLFGAEEIAWFDRYNEGIADIERKVAAFVGFDEALFHPTTVKGKEKRLGIFAREDDCIEFKTLGAKRYCDLVEVTNKKTGKTETAVQCTIAGLPKSAGVAKIKNVDDFVDGMEWNVLESKKKMAYYNDNQPIAEWVDRDGNHYMSTEYDKYGICIMPTSFKLTMSPEYKQFIADLENGEIMEDDENLIPMLRF